MLLSVGTIGLGVYTSTIYTKFMSNLSKVMDEYKGSVVFDEGNNLPEDIPKEEKSILFSQYALSQRRLKDHIEIDSSRSNSPKK